MEILIDYQIQLIQWLQGLGDWLTVPMRILSLTSSEYFYLIAAPAIYWCLDTSLGLQTGLFLMLSGNLNAILKILLHTARPFWISTSVKSLSFESSFGMPSGHAQNSITFWGTIGAHYRKRWGWVLVTILLLLVGLSRLYLAVHFPHDVIVGWLVGLLALLLFLRLSHPVTRWIKRFRIASQFLIILAFSLCLIFLSTLSMMVVSDFVLPAQWEDNAAISFPEQMPLNPLDLSGIVSNAGAFLGLAVGACWLNRLGGYDTSGSAFQLLGRYVLGVLGVLVFWKGLDLLFPDGDTLLPYLFRYIRYALIGVWVTALAPLLFLKLHLARPK